MPPSCSAEVALPKEIADAVVFLARSRSITGQIIAVDGGQHLAWETDDVVRPQGMRVIAEISRP